VSIAAGKWGVARCHELSTTQGSVVVEVMVGVIMGEILDVGLSVEMGVVSMAAYGKIFSSKVTWRETRTRPEDGSKQRYPL
jgi:trehalose utilization protein